MKTARGAMQRDLQRAEERMDVERVGGDRGHGQPAEVETHGGRDRLLGVETRALHRVQQLAGAAVLVDLERQQQRVRDARAVELRADAPGDELIE